VEEIKGLKPIKFYKCSDFIIPNKNITLFLEFEKNLLMIMPLYENTFFAEWQQCSIY